MSTTHNLTRQADLLRQILSQNNRPLALLMGAGCPLAIIVENDGKSAPLIPDIKGLTEILRKKCGEKTGFRATIDSLAEDGLQEPNVEDILSRIRELRKVAGTSGIRGVKLSALRDLDEAICREIVQVTGKSLPDTNTPYHRLALWDISIAREFPVEVFSTNYDLLIEQSLEDLGVAYFDGFVGSREPFFDPHAITDDGILHRAASFAGIRTDTREGRESLANRVRA